MISTAIYKSPIFCLQVLTAAHCVDDVNINSLRVGLGWNRLHTANGFEQTFGVAEAIIHR